MRRRCRCLVARRVEGSDRFDDVFSKHLATPPIESTCSVLNDEIHLSWIISWGAEAAGKDAAATAAFACMQPPAASIASCLSALVFLTSAAVFRTSCTSSCRICSSIPLTATLFCSGSAFHLLCSACAATSFLASSAFFIMRPASCRTGMDRSFEPNSTQSCWIYHAKFVSSCCFNQAVAEASPENKRQRKRSRHQHKRSAHQASER